MSGDFLQSLELDESVYGEGNLIVVHENGRADGGFVQHFIVADYLRRFCRQNVRVILVLVHHSEVHWQSIAGKTGWNFPHSKGKGELVTIDLVKERYTDLISSTSENSEFVGDPSGLIDTSTGSINLDKLFEKICSVSGPSSSSGDPGVNKTKQLIVIEDLSSLLYQYQEEDSSSAEKAVMEFLWKLRNFGASCQSAVLTLVNSASGSEESGDPAGTRFAKSVSQVLAQVSIQVSPLSTGFSPQISGYLTTRSKIAGKPKWVKSNHYKLEDRHVRVSALP